MSFLRCYPLSRKSTVFLLFLSQPGTDVKVDIPKHHENFTVQVCEDKWLDEHEIEGDVEDELCGRFTTDSSCFGSDTDCYSDESDLLLDKCSDSDNEREPDPRAGFISNKRDTVPSVDNTPDILSTCKTLIDSKQDTVISCLPLASSCSDDDHNIHLTSKRCPATKRKRCFLSSSSEDGCQDEENSFVSNTPRTKNQNRQKNKKRKVGQQSTPGKALKQKLVHLLQC